LWNYQEVLLLLKIDNASLSRSKDLERGLLFIRHTLPAKQTSLFSFKK
jgi:hypothetical protein